MDCSPFLSGTVGSSTDADGYLWPSRFTVRQREALAVDRLYGAMSRVPAGCRIAFRTQGSRFSLFLPAPQRPACGEDNAALRAYGRPFDMSDAFDISVGGRLLAPLDIKGGDKLVAWDNPGRETVDVTLYLPMAHIVGIGNMQCDGAVSPVPPRRKRLLFLGDSVVQGFMAKRPALGIGARIADGLGCEVINQGICGYRYDDTVLTGLTGDFALIAVALGTNDWQMEPDIRSFCRNAARFCQVLTERFPSVPVVCVSPLRRTDDDMSMPMGTFGDMQRALASVVRAFPRISFVDGRSLSSSDPSWFADGFLHPNAAAFARISERLLPFLAAALGQR